jgi:hypothetical protein
MTRYATSPSSLAGHAQPAPDFATFAPRRASRVDDQRAGVDPGRHLLRVFVRSFYDSDGNGVGDLKG